MNFRDGFLSQSRDGASTSKGNIPVIKGYLKKIIGPGIGEVLPLTSDEIKIGRLPRNDIFIDDVNVSRIHCILRHTAGSWSITDLGGINGTYLEHKRLVQSVPVPLKSGVGIYLGPPQGTPVSFMFFENKRKLNLDKGHSTLKRRLVPEPTIGGYSSDCSESSVESLRTRVRKMSKFQNMSFGESDTTSTSTAKRSDQPSTSSVCTAAQSNSARTVPLQSQGRRDELTASPLTRDGRIIFMSSYRTPSQSLTIGEHTTSSALTASIKPSKSSKVPKKSKRSKRDEPMSLHSAGTMAPETTRGAVQVVPQVVQSKRSGRNVPIASSVKTVGRKAPYQSEGGDLPCEVKDLYKNLINSQETNSRSECSQSLLSESKSNEPCSSTACKCFETSFECSCGANNTALKLQRVLEKMKKLESERDELAKELEQTKMNEFVHASFKQVFTNLVEEELMCNICTELFIKPVTLNCSHTFCEKCIIEWKKKQHKCPNCRERITSETRSLVMDSFISRAVEHFEDEFKIRWKTLATSRDNETKKSSKRKKTKRSRRSRTTSMSSGPGISERVDEAFRQLSSVNVNFFNLIAHREASGGYVHDDYTSWTDGYDNGIVIPTQCPMCGTYHSGSHDCIE